MAPDFEYFFRMSVSSQHSHTLQGLLYFDVPVVVFLAVVFHLVVKQNLIVNLPAFFQRRFQETMSLDFTTYLKSSFIVFISSAFLGSCSHLFWDSFTHSSGYFAKTLPFYKNTYIPFDGVDYPLFYALQHISTITGLCILFIYIVAKEPDESYIPTKPKLLYWILVFILAALIVWVRFLIRPVDYDLGNFVVSSISGLLLALIICGFINFREHGQKITMGTRR